MTNATMETRGAFGETLEALMRSRGMGPGPDEIRDLATAAGLDPEKMLAAVMDDSATADLEPDFSGLARALS